MIDKMIDLLKKISTKQLSLTSFVALISTFFLVSGFIAVRATINRLGLPEHAEITVDGYIQYGGRYGLTIIVHALIIIVVISTIRLALRPIIKQIIQKWKNHHIVFFLVVILTIASIGVLLSELSIMLKPAIFNSSHIIVPIDFKKQLIQFFMLETGIYICFIILYALIGQYLSILAEHRLLAHITSLCFFANIIIFILLPVCYGQYILVPDTYKQIAFKLSNETQKQRGLFIYGDASSIYILTNDDPPLLKEIPKKGISWIEYVGETHFNELATKNI